MAVVKTIMNILFPVAMWPNAGLGLLTLEVSRSHARTHHTH